MAQKADNPPKTWWRQPDPAMEEVDVLGLGDLLDAQRLAFDFQAIAVDGLTDDPGDDLADGPRKADA